jgi:hypothetical protein
VVRISVRMRVVRIWSYGGIKPPTHCALPWTRDDDIFGTREREAAAARERLCEKLGCDLRCFGWRA